MTNYRQIVDEIRAYLNSPDQTEDARIKEFANDYAQACREVNDRMLQCEELLQQGLRSQAIELAEVEPNLLETVALLDFPERANWEEVAASYGWQRAFGLKLETADRLNEGYAAEEQLRPLMNKHRRFALSRAPLNQRIGIIRQIAAIDSTSPFWEDDIRSLERARFQQLAQHGQQAAQQGDYDVLAGVLEEFETDPWLEKPQRSIATQMERLTAILIEKRTLPDIATKLEDAYKGARRFVAGPADNVHADEWAFHLSQGRASRNHWNQAVQKAIAGDPTWKVPPELASRVADPLRWLEQEDNRESLDRAFALHVQELQEAIETGATLAELQTLEAAVKQFGRDVPEPVLSRLKAYRLKLYAEKAVLYTLISVTGLALVGFCGLILWLWLG